VPDPGFTLDLPSGGGDDPVTAAIGLILLVIGLIVILPALVVILGLVLELAALLAVLPLVVGVRVALNRPWTVQVVAPDGTVQHTERVVGWRASGERAAELAETVRTAER
jgi:hypothetical protein